ncbi:ThuA domain-containing protein [Microbispora sp. H13382]|uniref:ThuA domain-containing protein n=1 Tax=Microbispora sp. H13382 TaxID=2729112 RepID=UPI0015FEDFDD|nr:ThuA domain-containing protein [Microbispora sp. H13382]
MSRKRLLALAALSAIVAPAFAGTSALAAPADDSAFRVLVFSKTAAFRHDSIPAGVAAIQKLGEENGFAVDATEDANAFTDANLAKYQAVVFLSTTGDPVSQPEQKASFERYIRNGGGFAGVHAASDSGYTWSWYGGLVGSYFRNHPAQQNATVKMVGQGAASNRGLPNRWNRWDEWYNFRGNPRDAGVRVLAELDETSYNPGSGAMGDHPIAWCHRYDGGRSWYTGMGHTKESFSDPLFLKHLLGGIKMAAGAASFPCDPHGD